MKIGERLKKKKQKMLDQMQRGREVTEQMKAEKKRKKIHKFKHMKPGAKRAITEGLILRKNPMSVMREEYDRRKYNRTSKKTRSKDK